ncbi:ABC transporter substrate-binding protein [Brachyspira hyodysenteriae]|uniref:ABC transporter substrate-binding protein n=2 Tax=Brachyspira hyodysenteriae TaxID=159 RepID=A0A3B6VYT3_BRAHO|nr:ABC transporter substrate-binding protein [Brachyspira hyodysenteriae]ANN62579.1 ABC transporter substrate-binding protein [Brachyspira hyodysenteriae ATCC 27164]KLI28899.1 ABC transporter substrate-binding protein [Brachyspira hyodysenteriae]MCZ9923740.1 ABC transporter substrate-binding protein [Brachyspira hyodysenteriae]TVL80979.1 ABC transporter substrate-binding protein [Brachyspira hyodysenteriae]TVL81747.1 ABC transporter substrate-binding protein [Brachyspira hyodysenteriae]
MKNNKTIIFVLIIIFVLVSSFTISKKYMYPKNDADKVITIGISQMIEHDALDLIYKGITDELNKYYKDSNKKINIDYQNAQGEQANCNTIAQKFVNDKKNIIIAIGTPSAQSAVNLTKDIPIIVSGIGDPIGARLVTNLNKPNVNVTGIINLPPISKQIELMHTLLPNAKKIGLLYCSSEINSAYQIKLAKEKLDSLGLEYIDLTVANANEIQQIMLSAANKVDAIFSPTDNIIANSMANVAMIEESTKIPVVCADASMTKIGGTVTYSVDYYDMGVATAKKTIEVLEGINDIKNIPLEPSENYNFVVNANMINKLGLSIPNDIYNN